MSKELILHCAHGAWTGAERSVDEMGRMPVLWKCDECGDLEVEL